MSYTTSYRPGSAQTATLDSRIGFIRKTYTHLAAAIIIFIAMSGVLAAANIGPMMLSFMSRGMFGWIIMLILFVGASSVARGMARAGGSTGTAYFGLGLFALVEALIFAPVFWIASNYFPGILPNAAIITLTTFVGLSGYVLIYNKDFSFLGAILPVTLFVAIGVLIAGMIFGFNVGIWYSAFVILIACGYILYDTSNVLRYYPTDQYVGAALELFASLALLFMYVIRILMQLQRR